MTAAVLFIVQEAAELAIGERGYFAMAIRYGDPWGVCVEDHIKHGGGDGRL